MKSIKVCVDEELDIVHYLVKKGFAKNKIKSYVKLGFISINGVIIKKLPVKVVIGDVIEIIKDKKMDSHLDILYEDNYYLIVNKEAGLLTISTSKEMRNEERTLYKEVRNYLNQK